MSVVTRVLTDNCYVDVPRLDEKQYRLLMNNLDTEPWTVFKSVNDKLVALRTKDIIRVVDQTVEDE